MFQKFFASLLTYAIGFQLMVGAIPNTPVSWVAYGQSCSSGLQWNSTLNRCLTTEEAAKVQEAKADCMKKESVDAQRACLNASLVARVQDAESKGEISGHKGQSASTMQMMIAFAAVAASGLFLMMGGGDCVGATSAWLMIGGGVAVIAGELMSSMTYKKEMKKAEEKLAKAGEGSANSNGSSDNSTATNVQADAFEAMIQKEQATIKAGKTKKNLYMVSLAAYGAAAALAAWETFRYFNPYDVTAKLELTCQTAKVPAPVGAFNLRENQAKAYALQQSLTPAAIYVDNFFLKKQRVPFTHYVSHNLVSTTNDFNSFIAINTEIERLRKGETTSMNAIEYEVLMANNTELNKQFDHSFFNEVRDLYVLAKNQVFVPDAQAELVGLFSLMSKAWSSTTLTAGGKFKALYENPMTRLIFAGILTTNSMIMMNNASKEIKKAEERKSFMEKLRNQVMASGTAFGCSTADRNSNLSKPQCYCYQEGGTLNPSRSKSATCKQYFGDKPALASNSLNATSGASTDKSCISQNGNLDSTCSCRTSNTCVTVKTPKVIGNTPSASVLGNLPATLNGLNSGALSAADVNASQMGSLAARMNGIKDKLLADPKNKKFAEAINREQEKVNKLVDGIRRDLAAAPPIASTAPSSSSFMSSTNPSDALEKMKADLKQEIKGYEGGVVNMNNAGAAKKDEFSLDGLNAGGVTISDEGLENQAKLDEIMATQYEMGDSEINSDPGANIFQILTNRYQRSGMRRLFGAEKVVPADKPAETPIAQ
jgi:hypothetical protein